MRHLSYITLILAIILFTPAHAEKASKEDLMRFMKAIGMYDMIEKQKLVMKKNAGKILHKQIQAFADEQDLRAFFKYIDPELQKFAKSISQTLDTDFAINTYMNMLSEHLTASEIQELTKYYEAGLGKKLISAQQKIVGPWTQAFTEDQNRKLSEKLREFSVIARKKAKEFHAKKK